MEVTLLANPQSKAAPSPQLEEAVRNLLATRRSIRKFTADIPDRRQITELIEMASHAPSASNKQSWRFFVCDQPGIITQAAQAVEHALQALLPKLELSSHESVSNYGRNFSWFAQAPVLIAPVYRPAAGLSGFAQDPGTQKTLQALEEHSALASLAMAIQNFQLHAHACGLASCCMSGPLIAENALKELFGIPDAWQMGPLIALGYPLEEPLSPGRKPVEHIIRWVTNS